MLYISNYGRFIKSDEYKPVAPNYQDIYTQYLDQ